MTNMNVKSLFLFLALTGLGTSCSNDELDEGASGAGSPGEIQLTFSGSGEGVEYTRAIASEAETEMKELDVYVFAGAAKTGPFYYVEKWSKATAPGNLAFVLQASGAGKVATIKPKEIAGLPYLRLYCVANSPLYSPDGANALALTAIKDYDRDNGTTNPAAPTQATAFEEAFTVDLHTNHSDTLLHCPLPMGGVGETKISGSHSKVNIELTRAVARLDIDNDRLASRFTIHKVSVLNGRKNGPLFKNAPLMTIDDTNRATELMTYGDANFRDFPGANRGTVTSALYLYPGEATDGTLLLLSGTRQTLQNEQIPASYKVRIQLDGNNLALGRNNRYCLHIGSVTEAQIIAGFAVEDWTSGGGVDMKPDDAAPVFAGENGDDLLASLTATEGNVPGVESADPYTLRLSSNKGSFTLSTYASAAIEAEIEALTRATDWLQLTALKDTVDTVQPGRRVTTLTFNYDNATGSVPQTITLRNTAAAYDPDLWTRIIVNGPYAPAVLSPVAKPDYSKGNTVADDATEASMYVLPDSRVQIAVESMDPLTIKSPKWLAVTPVQTRASGYTTVYDLKITDPEAIDLAAQATDTVTFINAADTAAVKQVAQLVLRLKSPALTAAVENDTKSATTVTTDERGVVTVTVNTDTLGEDGTFLMKVSAPEGLIAPQSACPWLTVNLTHAWEATESGRYVAYTISPVSAATDFADCTLKFRNALKNAADLTVIIRKQTVL